MTGAVRGLVRGVQLGMASGEKPVKLVSLNIQVAVTSSLLTSLSSISLTTPTTDAQSAYGSIQPKVTLGPNGLTGCTFAGGYVQMSVLQFSTNPYSGSLAVQTPLLRFSAASQATAIVTSGIRSQAHASSATFTVPGVPAYYIALQFSTVQKLSFFASTTSAIGSSSKSNVTLPACTFYNGVKYVPCKGCNISSYTNYNVTYSCFDITQLCPKTSVRRYLQEVEYESTGVMILDGDEEDDDNGSEEEANKDYINIKEEGDGYDVLPQRIIDSGGRASDDGADDDAQAAPLSGSVYGAIIDSVEVEFSSVLSVNPFVINAAVLSFCGSLAGFFILVIIVMLRLDYNERLQKIYVKKEHGALARKLLRKDITNGGNGDLGAAFYAHMGKLDKESRKNRSMINTMWSARRSAGNMRASFALTCTNDDGDEDEDEYENDSSQCSGNILSLVRGDIERDDGDSSDDNANKNDKKGPYQNVSAAIVTEFFHKLFPGRSIFKKKGNIFQIILVNHDYFNMFTETTLRESRTIRFLGLISIILGTIFADTVIFSIYFPSDSTCISMTDKVRSRYSYILLSSTSRRTPLI